jgi:hypothetical protein
MTVNSLKHPSIARKVALSSLLLAPSATVEAADAPKNLMGLTTMTIKSKLILLLTSLSVLHSNVLLADGAPDINFGTNGFVIYGAGVQGEPQIERGLCIQRLPDGGFVVLMQNNLDPNASTANEALLTRFSDAGSFLTQSRPMVGVEHVLGALTPCHSIFQSFPNPTRIALGGALDGPTATLSRVSQNNLVAPFLATVENSDSVANSALFGVVQNAAGDLIACGARFGGSSLPERGYCRKWDTTSSPELSFGNSSPFGITGHFTFDAPTLAATRIISVQFDAQGRILLSGLGAQSGGSNQLLTVRLTHSGQLDSSFCAGSACGDALSSAPGWRLDTIPNSNSVTNSLIVQRADGRIAVVASALGAGPDVARLALRVFESSGASHYTNSFAVGGRVSLGTGLALQADGKIIVPLSYRDSAQSVQLGALWRIPRDPRETGLIDSDFDYAPAGTPTISGLSIIRPSVNGTPANSVECNGVLVEASAITCVGLVRISSTPLNLDLLIARVGIELDPVIFKSGFEGP